MESVVLEIDIFVSSTGNFNFSMKKFKNKAFVENTGYLDNEIDCASADGLEGVKVATASLNDHFVFSKHTRTRHLLPKAKLHLPALGEELAALGAELTVLKDKGPHKSSMRKWRIDCTGVTVRNSPRAS